MHERLWYIAQSDMTILGKPALCSVRRDHLSTFGNPTLKVNIIYVKCIAS